MIVLDSRFQALDCGFLVSGIGIPDCTESLAGFWIRNPRIPDCRSKNFSDSGIGITDQSFFLKITWIMVLQRNRLFLSQMGLMFLWCTIIRVILTHNSYLKYGGNGSPSSIMVVPCITLYFYSEKKIKSPPNIIRRNAVIGLLRLEVRWPISSRIE